MCDGYDATWFRTCRQPILWRMGNAGELKLQSGEVTLLAEHFGRGSEHGSFIDGEALIAEWPLFRDIMLQRPGVSVVSAQRAARIEAPECDEVIVEYYPGPTAGEFDQNRCL